MTMPQGSLLFFWDDVELLPDLQRVQFVLDHLPDKDILAALRRMRGRGRNDFPAPAMWRALIAGVVLRHPTAAALLREPQRNPALLRLCGFEALPRQSAPTAHIRRNPKTGRMERSERPSPMRTTAPNAWAFSRFMANVVRLERRAGMVSDLAPRLRRKLMRTLPDYGAFMGADGKAIRSHSTGRALRNKGRTSDPDADRGTHAHRGVSKRTGKPWERITSWFGYKLHLIGDTQHELPVAFSVEKASVSERKVLARDLAALLHEDKPLAGRCREFSADRGYDQEALKRWLGDAHRIRPPIDIRLLWRGDWDTPPRRPGEPMMRPLDPSRVDNMLHTEQGRVSCRCPATGTMRPMALHDLDAKRNALKCLCPAAAYDLQCAGRAQCCANAGADPSKLGPTRRIHLAKANRRIFLPTPHGTRAKSESYARRSAMERLNARLDEGFRFESHATRGKARMTARVGLALAVMMALALGSVRADAPQRMRSSERPQKPPSPAESAPHEACFGPPFQHPEATRKAPETGLLRPRDHCSGPTSRQNSPTTTENAPQKAHSASLSLMCKNIVLTSDHILLDDMTSSFEAEAHETRTANLCKDIGTRHGLTFGHVNGMHESARSSSSTDRLQCDHG